MGDRDTLLLIDGYSQIYRGFFAIPSLTNPQGEPTNALFAMARFLLWIDREVQPTYSALVMDKGIPRDRLELLPDYKAQRPPMPEDLRAQLKPIREWALTAGWNILERDDTEADDLIAAIVNVRNGCDTYIVSSDKDLGQLVQPGVKQMVPGKKGKLDCLDENGIKDKFGVPPECVRDYIALIGDTSDNIPGVQGVGPKTAVELLKQFGSIKTLLSHPEKIDKPKLRDTIIAHREVLLRSRQLVTLAPELPPDWRGLASIAHGQPDWERLFMLARANGFKSLLKALREARDEAQNPTLF
ncbi:MAG: hypothetical protein K9N51_01850 [Candidatus Pacebacteria bacterium]|nr:hypothetical protein [Candidatus Paceibacterota bacterium]